MCCGVIINWTIHKNKGPASFSLLRLFSAAFVLCYIVLAQTVTYVCSKVCDSNGAICQTCVWSACDNVTGAAPNIKTRGNAVQSQITQNTAYCIKVHLLPARGDWCEIKLFCCCSTVSGFTSSIYILSDLTQGKLQSRWASRGLLLKIHTSSADLLGRIY